MYLSIKLCSGLFFWHEEMREVNETLTAMLQAFNTLSLYKRFVLFFPNSSIETQRWAFFFHENLFSFQMMQSCLRIESTDTKILLLCSGSLKQHSHLLLYGIFDWYICFLAFLLVHLPPLYYKAAGDLVFQRFSIQFFFASNISFVILNKLQLS